MQVLKFGGTSVANSKNIQLTIDVIKEKIKSDRTIVVVSALSGITDLLLNAGNTAASGNQDYQKIIQEIEQKHFDVVKELIPIQHQSSYLSLVKKAINELEDICNGLYLLQEISDRTKDRIAGYGEWLSSQIIAAKLQLDGVDFKWKDSKELIKTNDKFTKAEVDYPSTFSNLQQFFSEGQSHYLMPGFIASTFDGIPTTMGRGGSDFTAAIIAAALDAKRLEIWTDVSGMMTADPRLTKNAKPIERISYQEAMELSHFGAKVIYPPTIQPVLKKNIPVWIKNTFAPADMGTLITNEKTKNVSNDLITGISSVNNISLLTVEGSGMMGITGFSKRMFQALSNAQVNIILITQSSSEYSICVAVEQANANKAHYALNDMFAQELILQTINPIAVESNLSIIALVGDEMKSHPGVSGRMFSALGKNGVNIRAIAQGSTEKNISAVISSSDVAKAVNALHETFFETAYKQVHLFVFGAGNVGSKLLKQLESQLSNLKENFRIIVKLVGLANSKKMVFNQSGIPFDQWGSYLDSGDPLQMEQLIHQIINANLQNAVMVDITASDVVAATYEQFLKKSISVVACNKIAASSSMEKYNQLKSLARSFNAKFLFETNVGAALPIISTIKDVVQSGDTINRIDAVLSGTLNFVFNNYDGNTSFSSVVRQAQAEGYTEPDPRLDLGGVDVMRKILILAREAGNKMEMDAIENHKFLPEECMQGTVEEFYQCMEKHEAHFKQLLMDAQAHGCKLKFVASFENGKAEVGLQHIKPDSDLYHLYGKDNIVLLKTDRYAQQPLVIKGAGAGADVTASGVFADIVRASNQ
ncbi:MAG: bifunctional aspartate kinase/homoserine dehydrogenase I [Chitinophagaceae bacterium]|nr:MAG: bifunctional aspartate kinase/homoserine dehydrogenase I [Chitinophagaceae bacterium]